MSDIYRHADKSLKKLYKYSENRFRTLATTAKWDELNVIATVRGEYNLIDEAAQAEYKKIADEALEDVKKELVVLLPEKKHEIELLDIAILLMLLSRYDPKTEYRYDREWERKADRLSESLMAVTEGAPRGQTIINSPEIRKALQRALTLLNGQLRNMADTVTDETRLEAYRKVGITKVMWHSKQDNKVCGDCRERDGRVYPIYGVPPKHRRCRCWLTAVVESDSGEA